MAAGGGRRQFTVDEARALLPRVRELAATLRERKSEYDRHLKANDLLIADRSVEGDVREEPIARHRTALGVRVAAMQATIGELAGLGVEVKGLDQGLLDFPSERDGRAVYLCWKLDEPDITHWHDLTSGFAGRKPL